jgi:hypothetical protein
MAGTSLLMENTDGAFEAGTVASGEVQYARAGGPGAARSFMA